MVTLENQPSKTQTGLKNLNKRHKNKDYWWKLNKN